jgi:hypothetical protein
VGPTLSRVGWAVRQVEIGTFRYRLLHVAAPITRGRQIRLRIDAICGGQLLYAKDGNDFEPHSLDCSSTVRPRHERPLPWHARPPSDTGRSVVLQQSDPQAGQHPASIDPTGPRGKSRSRADTVYLRSTAGRWSIVGALRWWMCLSW